jgi:tetratricopeptide (TPR) repeat protein
MLAELRRLPPPETGTDKMHSLRRISLTTLLALVCAVGSLAQTKPAPPQTQTPMLAQTPAYNPMLAAHDVEVGKYYMDRGDLDGAIARYKDALRYRPNYAEPCLLLGEAYEKRSDFASAISYYRQYLKILPNASESKKVRKRVAELREKMKKNGANSGQPNR